MNRYELERAVMAAQLPGPSKAVMLVLCSRIWRSAGAIPSWQQPSLSDLAHESGWSRSTVIRHLRGLEAAGWVTRTRPTRRRARAEHAVTAYALTVPEGYPQARVTARPGLGAERDAAGVTERPGLGAERAEARRTVTHRSERPERAESSSGADDDLTEVARDELAALTGRPVTTAAAAAAVRLVLAGRSPASPAAYLRQAIRRDPARFTPGHGGPPTLAEREAELARIRAADRAAP